MERFSDDLLYSIFLHLLPSNFDSKTNTAVLRTIAPFNLSHVSRSWRALVLSRPSLWASFSIDGPILDPQRCERLYRLIKQWLRRSGSSPLTMRVYVGRKQRGDHLAELLYSLEEESYRWKDVGVYAKDLNTKRSGPPVTFQGSPLLTSLVLYLRSIHTVVCVDLSSAVIGNTPFALQVLLLFEGAKLVLPPPPKRNSLCLANLRELTFSIDHGSDPDDTLALLRSAPNLVSLRLEDEATTTSGTPHQEIISLPQLAHFALKSRARHTTRCLLNLLSCPSLLTLIFRHDSPSLDDDDDESSPPTSNQLPDLLRFFERSHPATLTTLHIKDDGECSPTTREPEILCRILEIVSGSLETLTLGGSFVDPAVVELLSPSSSNSSSTSASATPLAPPPLLCPSLTSLFLSRSSTDPEAFFQKERIEEMILSRWRGGEGPLRTVSVSLPGFKSFVEESARVRACVEGGLKVLTGIH